MNGNEIPTQHLIDNYLPTCNTINQENKQIKKKKLMNYQDLAIQIGENKSLRDLKG